jgi:hypothetical protein
MFFTLLGLLLLPDIDRTSVNNDTNNAASWAIKIN